MALGLVMVVCGLVAGAAHGAVVGYGVDSDKERLRRYRSRWKSVRVTVHIVSATAALALLGGNELGTRLPWQWLAAAGVYLVIAQMTAAGTAYSAIIWPGFREHWSGKSR
jgi:hypothetical protein